jgi:hypothetical protein
MVAFNKFQPFVANVCNGYFNLASDTMKVGLTNTLPVNTYSAYSSISEISSGNGYSAGGSAASGNGSTQTSGTQTFSLNNVTFTATGAIGPFRYVVLYDSTANSSYNLVGWWDYGSSITLANGDTFTVQWNGGSTSGTIFTLA